MIASLFGTNADLRRKKYDALIASFQKRDPGSQIFRFDAHEWNEARFIEIARSQSFFEAAYTIVVYGVLSSKELRENLLDMREEIASVGHQIIFIDDTLDKPALRWLESLGAQIISCESPKQQKNGIDPFALGSAVVSRNKKVAWVCLHEALRAGAAPEELYGPLAWKVKDALSKKVTPREFSRDELTELSRGLVSIYHEAHRGGLELPLALERLILAL